MFSMQKLKNSGGPFILFCSLVAGSSIFVFTWTLLSPSEPGNSVILGLSLPRLVFACGLLIIFITFVALAARAFNNREWAETIIAQWFDGGRYSKGTAWLAGISFGLGWIGCFLPAYRAGILANYWFRIQPLMMFILLVSISTLTVLLWIRSGSLLQEQQPGKTLRLSFVLFLASLAILAVMLPSKYGVSDLEDFWYGAGVPVLASQLLAAMTAGVLFLLLGKNWNTRRSDLIIFLLIYAVAAVLWAREPLQGSFLFIGPYPPNHVLYPFADAATFDAASQFALIGQRIFIFDNLFFERSLYLSFLVYLHSLFGQNYQTLMVAQAAIFAVFPALVYLIGRSLNMRAVGFVSAVIAIFRGVNSIAASNMIDLANPKMMLTDFPTAIGIALLVLFTCEWLKGSGQRWHYGLWVGGIIGLSLMLRTNALIFLLLVPLYALLGFGWQWKKWFLGSFLIILAVIIITLPWELRNLSLGGKMYGSIAAKIQNVIQQRYLPRSEPGSVLPQELSPLTLQSTQAIVSIYQGDNAQPCETVVCFAPKHFLHNVLTSILILPTSPKLDDLPYIVKDGDPFWRADWNGIFTPSALFFFILNLFFITLGISIAWKQQQLIGLTPLAIFAIYNLSNAFARTSGGRYIVPVDWIISLYFVLGILYLTRKTAEFANIKLSSLFSLDKSAEREIKAAGNFRVSAVLTVAVLFGIGSLIPMAEKLHAPRYSDVDLTNLLKEQESQLNNAGLNLPEIQLFLQDPEAEIAVGRALYPRFYKIGRGEIHFYPYTVMEFPRTGFILIGPTGEQAVLLPGEVPQHFPHGADVLILGCKGPNYTDALAVIILDKSGAVYRRSPMSELTCPLKQPVCDNNHICK